MRAPAIALRIPSGSAALAGLAASGGLLVLLLAGVAFGLAAPLALLGAGLALALLQYPGTVVLVAVAAVVVCEGPSFGLFPQTANLYRDVVKGVMPLDGLIALATAALAVQLVTERRPLRMPPPLLALSLAFVALAVAAGLVVGRAHGVGTASGLLAVHVVGYLLLIPLLIVNLRVDARQAQRVLGGAFALAVAKALVGLVAVGLGRGETIDGESALTYYEPTANWLISVALLSVAAGVVLKLRPPRRVLATAPLLLLALVLSYRRSFWIGDAAALVMVFVLALTTSRRRAVLPIVAVLAGGAWLLGSVTVQSDTPLAERVRSLSPTQVVTKPADRYRLDERANVIAEIRRAPLTGRGIKVPWRATERMLPVEVSPAHEYVHFASLWWWLHMGLLGLIAYIMLLVSGTAMSWRVYRRARAPMVRAFGLGSLCSMVALLLIETAATFTGVDARFTVLFAAQLGLLAVLVRLTDRRRRYAAR